VKKPKEGKKAAPGTAYKERYRENVTGGNVNRARTVDTDISS